MARGRQEVQTQQNNDQRGQKEKTVVHSLMKNFQEREKYLLEHVKKSRVKKKKKKKKKKKRTPGIPQKKKQDNRGNTPSSLKSKQQLPNKSFRR